MDIDPTSKLKFASLMRHASISEEFICTLADEAGLDISGYDMHEILMGYEDEKEHDDNGPLDVVGSPVDLLKITLAHLDEDPSYYTKLKKKLSACLSKRDVNGYWVERAPSRSTRVQQKPVGKDRKRHEIDEHLNQVRDFQDAWCNVRGRRN